MNSRRFDSLFTVCCLITGLVLSAGLSVYASENATEYASAERDIKAVTTADQDIDIEDLEFLLKPLTRVELEKEAAEWQLILAEKTREVSNSEIRANQLEHKAEELAEMAGHAEDIDNVVIDGDKQDMKEAKQAIVETSQELPATSEKLKQLAVIPNHELSQKIDGEDKNIEQKKDLLAKKIVLLRLELGTIVTRFGVVLDELERKGGDAAELRLYSDAVSGIHITVGDTATAWLAISAWLKSDEGGILMLTSLIKFIIFLCFVWLLAKMAGRLADRLTQHSAVSVLLENFIKVAVRRTILFIGFIVSLAILGINITPVLALIGAVGLVVGLALQGTLSNFASGVLILIYRPFDVNDLIEVGGDSGRVDSMTLLSTAIRTLDNKLIIIPNNSVWGDSITNVTGSDNRRIDMMFGIGYGDDITKAKKIMKKILDDHPKVLKNPEPVVRVHELADSSVNFACRPWVKTDDYLDVYWDITEAVKREFDAQGVSIPFPQQDVHLISKETNSA